MIFMPMFSPIRVQIGGIILIAEDFGDGVGIGYSIGTFAPEAGSISGEPLVGHALVLMAYDSVNSNINLCFEGDAVAALSGKTLYVDSAQYPLDLADIPPAYDVIIPGLTVAYWQDGSGPIFVDGLSYNIRID